LRLAGRSGGGQQREWNLLCSPLKASSLQGTPLKTSLIAGGSHYRPCMRDVAQRVHEVCLSRWPDRSKRHPPAPHERPGSEEQMTQPANEASLGPPSARSDHECEVQSWTR
jgi:hypothetical protein